MYAATGGPNMKWGASTLAPRWQRPCQHLTENINFDIAIEEFGNKKARKVTV